MLKRFAALFMAFALLLPLFAACAEEVFELSPDAYAAANVEDAAFAAAHLTTDRPYVRLTCTLDAATEVSLSIRDSAGAMVYARDYGAVSGAFRTEDIYLPQSGDSVTYRAQLTCGASVWSFPIIRKIARLTGNAACSAGYPLRELTGADTWQTVTFLSMTDSETSCDLHASNRCNLGTVTFTVQSGTVTANILPIDRANVSVERATVYVARTAEEAQTLGSKHVSAASGTLGTPIDAGGAEVVAVYVTLKVSYDPAELDDCGSGTLDGQAELWQRMQDSTAMEAVG